MPSEVLVLVGEGLDIRQEKHFWGSVYFNKAIEFMSIADFKNTPLPEGSRFKQIIISGHGRAFDENIQPISKKEHRKNHAIAFSTQVAMRTVEIIEICAAYTEKILVSACYASAVMKDLQDKMLQDVKINADVVALGGSKYSNTAYDKGTSQVAKEFYNNGIHDLYSHVREHYPDTVAIYSKSGEITKLEGERVFELKNNDKSPILAAAPRHIKQPRKMVPSSINNPKDDSWWIRENKEQKQTYSDNNSANHTQDYKDEALVLAILKGKEKDVAYHIYNGASPYARTASGEPVIDFAKTYTNTKVIEILEKARQGDPDLFRGGHLHYAVVNGDAAKVQALLEGAEGREKDDPNINYIGQKTLLLQAVEAGNAQIVQLLMDHGAKPDPATGFSSYLLAAIKSGKPEIVDIFLKENIDLNQCISDCDKRPCYTLIEAIYSGESLIVRALLNAGAQQNKQGTTETGSPLLYALSLAAVYGWQVEKIIDELLANLTPEQITSERKSMEDSASQDPEIAEKLSVLDKAILANPDLHQKISQLGIQIKGEVQVSDVNKLDTSTRQGSFVESLNTQEKNFLKRKDSFEEKLKKSDQEIQR